MKKTIFLSIRQKSALYLPIIFFVLIVFIAPRELLSAPYYEGKRMTIIVGYGPGGGYDRMARLLAKHLPKHIPGKPTIIVENMPGADSMIAANHLYNIAKPDGLTIGTFSRGLPFAQLTKVEGVKFDLTKYSWIGSSAVEAIILVIRADLPYKTFNDLLKIMEPIHLGGTGAADPINYFPALLKEFLGLKMKMVTYPSSAEVMLALERKEVDGRAGSYSSLKPFIERGLVRPLIRGRVSEPGIETLQVNEELTTDEKGKTMMAMLSTVDRIGRPYVAPPGTPVEIITILREAFAKVAKDPELKEDAKKNKMDIEYVPAEECLKVLNYLLNQPKDIITEFGKYIKLL
ncbi:MAG: tripartite tricarboxylate transporter substrate-binding protein [Thermodesulfobacteriota bacterium]|nr:tripartite tricarboxylate transporter substrate-binding protein [Thermodesulfobacteriota bacterium]